MAGGRGAGAAAHRDDDGVQVGAGLEDLQVEGAHTGHQFGGVAGADQVGAGRGGQRAACASASASVAPVRTTSAPQASTAATLAGSVPSGMTTVQGASKTWLAYAIDWAWLPVE